MWAFSPACDQPVSRLPTALTGSRVAGSASAGGIVVRVTLGEILTRSWALQMTSVCWVL